MERENPTIALFQFFALFVSFFVLYEARIFVHILMIY